MKLTDDQRQEVVVEVVKNEVSKMFGIMRSVAAGGNRRKARDDFEAGILSLASDLTFAMDAFDSSFVVQARTAQPGGDQNG